MIMKKKFYVGSRTVLNSGWMMESFDDAVKHATKHLADNPDYEDCEEVPIVQVVGIVKRKKPVTPVIVERVK